MHVTCETNRLQGIIYIQGLERMQSTRHRPNVFAHTKCQGHIALCAQFKQEHLRFGSQLFLLAGSQSTAIGGTLPHGQHQHTSGSSSSCSTAQLPLSKNNFSTCAKVRCCSTTAQRTGPEPLSHFELSAIMIELRSPICSRIQEKRALIHVFHKLQL